VYLPTLDHYPSYTPIEDAYDETNHTEQDSMKNYVEEND